MRTLLIVLMVLIGIVFIGTIMLMSPKGWLWAGIGGASGWSERWSKKSLESTLKKIAAITWVTFVVISLFLPYVD